MLSYIRLRDFKSFSFIELDLRKAYGEPKECVFIYGENGSGKSNLMSSIAFLRLSFETLSRNIELTKISKDLEELESLSEEMRERVIFGILGASNLSSLVKNHQMIGSEGPMSLELGFRLEGYDGSYFMEFSGTQIVREELNYRIRKRQGKLFSLDANGKTLSPTVFQNKEYKNELEENIDKYWGKHTFMAILFNEMKQKNAKYLAKNLGKSLLTAIDWLDSISYLCRQPKGEMGKVRTPFKVFIDLEEGTAPSKDKANLEVAEEALNTFFTRLYSDVKKVFYKYKSTDNGISYKLYFSKLINGKNLDIPVDLESTGTRKLLHVFPILFAAVAGQTVLIDEIDNGIHDLLICNLMEYVSESLNGQFIATTHNTLLLEKLPAENVYMIVVDPEGNKEILSIVDYEKRTQKTNNIRKRYLDGAYDGIPYTGYLDFQELVDDVKVAIGKDLDPEDSL